MDNDKFLIWNLKFCEFCGNKLLIINSKLEGERKDYCKYCLKKALEMINNGN